MDDEARFTRYVAGLTNEQVLLLQRVASRRASHIYMIRDRKKWEFGVAAGRVKQELGYRAYRNHLAKVLG